MSFLNPLSLFFWFIPTIPIIIFLINRRNYKIVKFSSIKHLINLKTNEINRIKLLNILLLLLRTLILIIILIIIMRPHVDKLGLSNTNSNNKIINYIFIDDSFSNKYGFINNKERTYLIDKIVNNICQNYPLKSRLKIATLNKGIIFDGFNSHDLKFSSIDSKAYQFNVMNQFLLKEEDHIKNIHLVSNSNKLFVNESKRLLNEYIGQKYSTFYHYMPNIVNNQYIANVELLDNNNGIFYYKIVIGNMFEKNSKFNLSAYKNTYQYDSNLILDQKIPLFTKKINLNPDSYLIDTIAIRLKPEHFSEILFKLENLETQNDWTDDRLEDNYYSYIMDIPKKINASIIYNSLDDQKYISSILNSFQIITKNIDTNFFNIDYVYSNGLDQYSNIIKNKDILIFLGYNIFSNTDLSVVKDFLKNKDSQIILFPNKNDINKNKYIFNIDDSLTIENSYVNNILDNYDTIKFQDNLRSKYQNFIDQKLKLYNYFYHQSNQNSKFKINETNSLWSRFKIGEGYFDLFGFIINSGNNFFSSESFFSAPFLYSITLNEKIDYSKNNLLLNHKLNISDIYSGRLKLVDLNNDSIIFHNNEYPIISTKSTKGLISDDKLLSLYSFNPLEDNFNNNFNIDIIQKSLTTNIIDYSNSLYIGNNLNIPLNNNEITKYFIYFLFILLFLEMILSNAKPSRTK